ncbi:alanine-phosphoribitol ligase [Gordoniibacillus kamchatkensis]|uniref:D-alanyl carrier protein n=1 Tax=Gordoniibacillus kamchatkensis TaxID=1590651 RepID=A0ABR5AK46_9BACL|nr:D-alanine--poly(phosphoribitol) ligase subunit DltC [Paenibacillus sp. VKM B-2647]KIL41346.1 alanine-phosphoribitol ligase [Paenibacillus sp. VKM B-2647]
MDPFREKALNIIADVCKTDEVIRNPDVPLFESGLLDSFGVVELLVLFESELQKKIPITDFDRETWNTPNRIVAELEGSR